MRRLSAEGEPTTEMARGASQTPDPSAMGLAQAKRGRATEREAGEGCFLSEVVCSDEAFLFPRAPRRSQEARANAGLEASRLANRRRASAGVQGSVAVAFRAGFLCMSWRCLGCRGARALLSRMLCWTAKRGRAWSLGMRRESWRGSGSSRRGFGSWRGKERTRRKECAREKSESRELEGARLPKREGTLAKLRSGNRSRSLVAAVRARGPHVASNQRTRLRAARPLS